MKAAFKRGQYPNVDENWGVENLQMWLLRRNHEKQLKSLQQQINKQNDEIRHLKNEIKDHTIQWKTQKNDLGIALQKAEEDIEALKVDVENKNHSMEKYRIESEGLRSEIRHLEQKFQVRIWAGGDITVIMLQLP